MFGKILDEWCELKGVEVDIAEELRRKRPEELPPNVFAEIVDQL